MHMFIFRFSTQLLDLGKYQDIQEVIRSSTLIHFTKYITITTDVNTGTFVHKITSGAQ